MLKAGIFLDGANLSRCGGWGMDVSVVRKLVEEQGFRVVRANTYVAVDREREEIPDQREYAEKQYGYRDALRRAGFHVVTKEVKWYTDEDGNTVSKANADIDLAVDALLQSGNLDYVLLGSGDGDFIRLVRALQNHGKRVDVLAFSHVSGELRREADHFFNGYLVPQLLRTERAHRGQLYQISPNRDWGKISYMDGYKPQDVSSVFLHISDFKQEPIRDEQFLELVKDGNAYIEFDIAPGEGGKQKAVDAIVFRPKV